MKHSSHLRKSRRRFTQTMATALVAAPFVPAVSAQTATPSPTPSPSPTPPNTSPMVESYVEFVRARFPDALAPDELERVKRDIENNLRTTERLRAVALKNADEPDFVFSA